MLELFLKACMLYTVTENNGRKEGKMTCSFCGASPTDWIRQGNAVWVICPNCGAEYIDHHEEEKGDDDEVY